MNPICIIIPFYNEANRFPADEFLEFLQSDCETSFCLVNDGSTDKTGDIIVEFIKNLHCEQNFGIFVGLTG